MKLLLVTLFSLTAILLNAQTNFATTAAKFTTEISLPFSTPEELPLVGEIADDVIEIIESEVEIKKLKDLALFYPEITEELYSILGENSDVLNRQAQLFPFGKFKIGETTFLIVLETGREARSQNAFQSLVLLAFDKDFLFKDIRYLKHERVGYEYDEEEYEDVVGVVYKTFISSTLVIKNNILNINSIEQNETEIIREDDTEVEKSSNTTNFKYLPSLGQFEVQFE